jgi:methylated-DNA-protein-cysteine methyltransferase related protein
MNEFQKKVLREIRRIPRGTTRSYGEIAIRAGKPGAPRAVVAAMRGLDIPWWRVARKDGSFAPQVAFDQEQLLRQEGWKPPKGKTRKSKGRKRVRKVE